MVDDDVTRAAAFGSPFDVDTEVGRDLAAVDWAATALGPWQQWSAGLVNTVRLMLGSRFAMWLAWGPDLTFFCNDAYRRDTLGAKYPWALGKPAREVWSEIWADIGPRIDSVISTGEATWDEGLLLFLERSGYAEETYHTFSYSPVTGDAGRIEGMLCVVSEDTGRVIGERRMALLRDLGADLGAAATEHDVAAATERELTHDPYDVPFAVGYLFDGESRAARLCWACGVPVGSVLAPPLVGPGDTALQWHHELFETDGEFVAPLDVPGAPSGGWPEPPTHTMAVPLRQVGERDPYGYLMVGLNRYRPLDDEHRGFVQLVAGQIAAAIARARAFEQERERSERLAELDRAKTTFFTNVSHELRTPLTLLLGPTEDALADAEHALPGAQRRRLEIVQRNGERLLKLVNTLLDFSRLESGRVEPVYEQLDLSRYTGELVSMFESAFARSGLTLVIECDPLPVRPFVDREMWSKIVLNLVSNALKATFEGGVTVRLGEQPDGAGVRLEVIDTGVGIPEAEQGRLFERFHRVSGAALRSHEGSGIGLALVAELTRLHGGSVAVTSTLGRGSTFTVELPYGHAHLPAQRVATEVVDDVPDVTRYGVGYLAEAMRWLNPARPATAVPPPREPADLPGADRPRVLVVDDNADMRDYVGDLLRGEYALDTATDGLDALERVRAAAPDLVLTDVMMPGMDGFGLLRELREHPETAHIPVVMLSARSGDDATVEGLEAGADDYLVKPFSARELMARVRANLELDRVRRVVAELERNQRLLDQAERLAHLGSWELDVRSDRARVSAELLRIITGEHPFAGGDAFAAGLANVDDDDRPTIERALAAAVEDGTPFDVEVRARRLDGTRFVGRLRGVAVTDDDGLVTHVRGSLQDVTEQRAAEIALARAHADREAAAREHAIAAELQQSLLPSRVFDADRLDVAAFYRAGVEGTQVGGDWYDVIDLGDGRTALIVGDVMGRGVRAAAVMGQLRATARAYARIDLPPAEVLSLIDDAVREISADTIVTCVYAVYDPRTQSLSYANAGHLPPLITIPGEATRRLTAGGPPLGAGHQGEVSETVQLPTGAILTMYTDGLVERRGTDIDEGIGRLAELVGTAAMPVARLPEQLVEQLLPDEPDDDVAVLICQVTGADPARRRAEHAIEAGDTALADARRFVQSTLDGWGVDDDVHFDVQVAVSELTTNALRHGLPPVVLHLQQREDRLLAEVHDAGPGGPAPRRAGPREASGRGLLIVGSIAERWGTRRTAQGKAVWCRFRLPAAGESPQPAAD